MPRLAVIDAAAVDGRRRLVLVRRDNIEHLLMIGGPSDVVVETNIVRAMPARDALPQRAPGVEAPPPRIAPMPDTAWEGEPARTDMFDHVEPAMPEPPPRPARPSFADEARRRAPAMPPPPPMERTDPLADFAPPPLGGRSEPRAEPLPPRMPRGEPAMPRSEPMPRGEAPIMPRSEPMMPRPTRSPVEAPKAPVRERVIVPPPPPPAPPPASAADQNLAEMAQRLEAALRRPPGDNVAPPVQPEAPPARPARNEAPPSPAPQKTSFENLEDEMASLLGRPKNPS
jgi:hypothetical protein